MREGADLEKLLSGEVKEIVIAALLTLEETKNELEGSLKKNSQVIMCSIYIIHYMNLIQQAFSLVESYLRSGKMNSCKPITAHLAISRANEALCFLQ